MGDASWVDSMPEVYDRGLRTALFGPYAEHVASLAEALAPQRVLELAAGTGIGTAALVRALPGAEIVATDLNDAMVGWGAVQVPGASWQQADAQRLDLPDASFDLVVCQFGAMFLPDRPGAYAESARVLKPGGTLLLTIWDAVERSSLAAAMVASLDALLPDEPPSFLHRVPYGYHDPEQIRADLEKGGLTDVSVEQVLLRGPAESAQQVALGLALGSPLRFDLERVGDVEALAAALGAEMTRRLGEGPLEGSLSAFVATGTRP
jgi:SAM-dependent methyltransferase